MNTTNETTRTRTTTKVAKHLEAHEAVEKVTAVKQYNDGKYYADVILKDGRAATMIVKVESVLTFDIERVTAKRIIEEFDDIEL